MSTGTREPVVSHDVGVLAAGWSHATITDKIADRVLQQRRWSWRWWVAFAVSGAGVVVFVGASVYLLVMGPGIWGVNIPVAWGYALANFVWWIGFGHAGTFISAILLLLHQAWRTSINRFAEAMTLFAAGIAGIFPILHLGRPWFFYWLLPYPNRMELWPQWRSPLVWDIFAISTYLLVSLLFWYSGLIPDLATLRDRARTRFQQIAYGLFALGWRGEARHWARYETMYRLLAGLAAPLVISVHSIVALDFSIGNTPGYHSTMFPPYFVVGALFSGFAMVLTLAIPLRHWFWLHDFITTRHLDLAARLVLVTSLILGYCYLIEAFTVYYSGDVYEIAMLENRWAGVYAPAYWGMLVCNVLVPQALWLAQVRRNALGLFVISLIVDVGMWVERAMIVITSLYRDFLPSSWDLFVPTRWDWAHLVGSIGLFAFLFLLFLRFLPAISMAEMRKLVRESAEANR